MPNAKVNNRRGNLILGHSFNRDPESAATQETAICKQLCWQLTAGSAFCSVWSVAYLSVSAPPRKRAPRREVAGMPSAKVNNRRGNLALGRG
jgi:hypothetical protein